MNYFILILFYLFFIYETFCSKEGIYFPKKDNIIILNDYTFEEAFNEYQYLIIFIYSEFCYSCKHKISPIFSNLYKEINDKESELKDIVSMAKVDGTYNKFFLNKYNILGYPNVILFKDGTIQGTLNHIKTVDDIIVFLRKKILRPIQYINNKEIYNRLTNSSHKESFITYFGKNKEEINSLKEISYKYNFLTFINIQDKSLINDLNAKEGQLSINKYFDEPIIIESSKNNELWTEENIDKFIKKYNHKLLIDFTSMEGEHLLNKKKNILLLINKQELSEKQIKRMEYMDKINIKEIILSDENKVNNKNFLQLSKNVRDIIQSSYIIFRKNFEYEKENHKMKEKDKIETIMDEDDPFGFESMKKEIKDCEKRQIQFINKLKLDNKTNCEIRLIDFQNFTKPGFYKLNCGEENLETNINFIRQWNKKNIALTDKGIKFDLLN